MFEGKVAVVTGGSSGIGLAIAKEFASHGAKVIITGRQRAKLDAAAKEIGAEATGMRADASNLAELDALYKAIGSKFGKIDFLVANAGGGEVVPLGAITEEHYDRTFDTNVKGVLFTVQKALPLMMQGGGSIVLIGSTASINPIAGMSVYGGTKAALRNFVRVWVQDLKGSGIRVNVVSPGPVLTQAFTDALPPEHGEAILAYVQSRSTVGRLGQPEDIAKAVAFVASDAAGYINGVELFSDGGASQI